MLIDKIKSKEAVIGIVGLGYVGLPLMFRFAEAGFHVLGFDIEETKMAMFNRGRSYIKQIGANHEAFDYKLMQEKSKLIVDTRGRYHPQHNNVVKA